MNRGDGAMALVDEEDGKAVGRLDAHQAPGGEQRVAFRRAAGEIGMDRDIGMNLVEQRDGFGWGIVAVAEAVLEPVESGERWGAVGVVNELETQDSGSIEEIEEAD